MDMVTQAVNLNSLITSVLFSFLGIAIFVIGFWAVDLLTPYKLWNEICEKSNMALAIFVGFCALGISVIIASAIH